VTHWHSEEIGALLCRALVPLQWRCSSVAPHSKRLEGATDAANPSPEEAEAAVGEGDSDRAELLLARPTSTVTEAEVEAGAENVREGLRHRASRPPLTPPGGIHHPRG